MCEIWFRGIRRAEFKILTLGLDSYWRNLDYVPEKLGFSMWSGVCCVDDVIFCSGWVNSNKVIVAFEVGLKKFRVIPLPNGADSRTTEPHIIQIGGNLGFVNVYTKVTNSDAMTSHDEWKVEAILAGTIAAMNFQFCILFYFSIAFNSEFCAWLQLSDNMQDGNGSIAGQVLG
ncbi:hypothetical protein LguiB_012550 [Lonicera macranthoides]